MAGDGKPDMRFEASVFVLGVLDLVPLALAVAGGVGVHRS